METININGDIFHLNNDELHKEDGPAIEFANGIQWWMQKGKLHRENGPAIVDKREFMEYWINGESATEEEIVNIKRNKWIDRSYEKSTKGQV